MSMLDLAAFDATPLQRDPFDFVIVPGFLKAEALQAINRDFPLLTDPGNYKPEETHYGATFRGLLDELNAPAVSAHFASKFGVDLDAAPTTITIRKYCESSDGNIHTDHWSKIVTLLIYFNERWPHEGGRLRLLRSLNDLENYAVEVLPQAGTLLAFRRSAHSFHGHKRFEGERRMLQMSWVRRSPLAQSTQRLARTSTRLMKRVLRQFH